MPLFLYKVIHTFLLDYCDETFQKGVIIFLKKV
jgi:hypothetical protein